MDVLSDVLDTVKLTSTVFVRTALNPPWGLRARPRDHFAFHVVSSGRCWLEVDGMAPFEVGAGDALVISPGRGHALRSDPDAPARYVEELLAEGALCREPDGTDATSTQLVCGSFRFDEMRGGALHALLPPVLHVRPSRPEFGPSAGHVDDQLPGRWLAQTLDLLAYESFADRPGNATVLNRLCDALFIYLVRSHLSTSPKLGPAWTCGLEDRQIGEALRLMHEQAGHPWNVPKLAAHVGMSRSAFAARFAYLVGETPIRYLMRWRAQKAASMLRGSERSIESIASHVGYDSAVAFSKAFKRSIGVPPGAYRRQRPEDHQ